MKEIFSYLITRESRFCFYFYLNISHSVLLSVSKDENYCRLRIMGENETDILDSFNHKTPQSFPILYLTSSAKP